MMLRDAATKAKVMNKSMTKEDEDETMTRDVAVMKDVTMVTSPKSLEGNRRKRLNLEQETYKKAEDNMSEPITL